MHELMSYVTWMSGSFEYIRTRLLIVSEAHSTHANSLSISLHVRHVYGTCPYATLTTCRSHICTQAWHQVPLVVRTKWIGAYENVH